MFRRDLLHLQDSSVCTVSWYTPQWKRVPDFTALVELVLSPDSVGQNIPGVSKKEGAIESDVIILT
jgi:hypothetical protein